MTSKHWRIICLSVIHDRCLPDMRFLIENWPIFIGRYWELFLGWNLMRFHVSLLVKARNNSQSEKNILIFQLKSAFSTLILHSVSYNLKTINFCQKYKTLPLFQKHLAFIFRFFMGFKTWEKTKQHLSHTQASEWHSLLLIWQSTSWIAIPHASQFTW